MPKLQTNGAKQKRTTYMILLLWAAVCFALLVVDWCCWAPNRLDADMASEQLLANLLAQEGGVMSTNWYYSTELRVLNTQLVMAPLFRLFTSWHTVRVAMYHGAPMVLVPADHNNIELLSRVKELLSPAGFGRFSVTTAEKHDEMIAFTSQMAHVVSNAYIKSPTAGSHKGFSAGSYKDLTRVAWLNPQMWAELFLENKDFLMRELNILIENLQKYELAMEQNDLPGLTALLDEGRRRKEEVDGH